MRRALITIAGLALLGAIVGCSQTETRTESTPGSTQPSSTVSSPPPPAGGPPPADTGKPAVAVHEPAGAKPNKMAASKPGAKPVAGKMITTPSGLKYEDIKVGTGPSPQPG